MRAPPAGPGLPDCPGPVAPGIGPGQRHLPGHRPAADDLHRQPVPWPAFRRERRPPRLLADQPALLLPATWHLAAGPAAARACRAYHLPSRLLDRSSRTSRVAVLAGPCQGAASSPVRPLSATAPAGPGPLPSRTRSRAGLAGQHLAGTGYGPDLCPYRQPGATSCRACRMFPIACYGLTPRCREVKR